MDKEERVWLFNAGLARIPDLLKAWKEQGIADQMVIAEPQDIFTADSSLGIYTTNTNTATPLDFNPRHFP